MLPQFILGYFLLQTGFTVILAFILFTVIIAAGVFYDRHNKNIYLLMILILIPIIITILSPFRTTDFQSKHLIFVSPLIYLLIVHAILKIPKKTISILLLIFVGLLNLVSLRTYYSDEFIKENWRDAASFVSKNSKEGDIICYDPSYAGFGFDYYDKTSLKKYGLNKDDIPQTLLNIINSRQRIWLIQNSSSVAAINPEVKRMFRKNCKAKTSKHYKGSVGNINLTLYLTNR